MDPSRFNPLAAVLSASAGFFPLESAEASAQTSATASNPIPAGVEVVLHASAPNHWPDILSNLDNLLLEWQKARIRAVSIARL